MIPSAIVGPKIGTISSIPVINPSSVAYSTPNTTRTTAIITPTAAIDRICAHYGVSSENAFVLSNGIFLTAGSARESFFAKVQHIPVSGTHLDKVAAVNQLSREIVEGKHSIEEARQILENIRRMPGKKRWMQVAASGVGSAAFCLLFGGTARDSLAALLAGLLLYLYVLWLGAPHLSKIVIYIGDGALVTLVGRIL